MLLEINPADIFLKIRTLCALVFGLFGLMHLLAALAWALDRDARRVLLGKMMRLRARDAVNAPSEPWLWAFSLVRKQPWARAPAPPGQPQRAVFAKAARADGASVTSPS